MIRAKQTRRQFLQKVGIGAAASLTVVGSCSGQEQPSVGKEGTQGKCTHKRLFELGLASYTLREFNLDKTLEMTRIEIHRSEELSSATGKHTSRNRNSDSKSEKSGVEVVWRRCDLYE